MYLRFDSNLEFPQLANLLHPENLTGSLDWDYENVYEWMYINLTKLPFSLNVSREHGMAEVADDILDQLERGSDEWKRLVQPGSVYVMGWERIANKYVDELPNDLPAMFADRLAVDIAVFSGRLNVDAVDGEPLRVVKSQPNGR